MIPLYSTKQVRDLDDFAINQLGIPGIVLMENASTEIFHAIVERVNIKKDFSAGIICGRGNNGGDGFAVARHFANNNIKVIVIHTANEEELSDDARLNFNILKKITSSKKIVKIIKYDSIKDLSPLKNCSLIIDAMLGSGAEGELREPFKRL
jgi:NAD(P)H-hydrate epimerase